jgi:hypothetical protein
MKIFNKRKTVTHIKSGRKYTIFNKCMLKVNDSWEQGIIYEGVDKNTSKQTLFVRTIDDFDKNFE